MGSLWKSSTADFYPQLWLFSVVNSRQFNFLLFPECGSQSVVGEISMNLRQSAEDHTHSCYSASRATGFLTEADVNESRAYNS